MNSYQHKYELVNAGFDKQIFLAVLSGILLFLSFPKYGAGIVAWIALVPLMYSCREVTVTSGFIRGFVAGLVFNVGLLHWIAFVIVNYGHLPLPIGIFAMLLMAAYLSIYVALFTAGLVYLRDRGIAPVIAAPLLWTCLEYAKSHLLTGFPWENLAYSQYLYIPLIQITDITGIYGLTFVIVLINAIICDLLAGFIGGLESKEWKRLLMEAAGGFLMLLALWSYGDMRVRQMREIMDSASSIDISLIQGNIDQSIKWNPQHQDETLEIYKSLSGRPPPISSGLIIWPETAAPFYFQDMSLRSREVVLIAKDYASWLLFGSPSYIRKDNRVFFFNSAFLLSPEGVIAGRYDKVHLVPYGEYVPMRRFFPFIGKLVASVGDFGTGKGYYPLLMGDRKVGVLICYEAIFPESSLAYKRMGAGLLVNITNDAWFGRSSAPYQHLSMTAFRAVENRLYVLRAANTGISAIIDPTGKILSHTDLFIRTDLKGKARFIDKRTYYMAYGDAFVYLCLISLLLILLNPFMRRKKCWKN